MRNPISVGSQRRCGKCKSLEVYYGAGQEDSKLTPAPQTVLVATQWTPSTASSVPPVGIGASPSVQTHFSGNANRWFDAPSIANNLWASLIWVVFGALVAVCTAYFVAWSAAHREFGKQLDASMERLEQRLLEKLRPAAETDLTNKESPAE